MIEESKKLGIEGKPEVSYEIPIWEVNHSKRKLYNQIKLDPVAYALGFEMNPIPVDAGARAYPNFSDKLYPHGNITRRDYDTSSEVYLTMDFNRDPQSAALCQKSVNSDGDIVCIVFDEVWNKNMITEKQADSVADRLELWDIDHVYLAGDNTSNQRSGNYGRGSGKNDWDIVKEVFALRGISFSTKYLSKQNPKRKVRVDKANNFIYNIITHRRRLLIHERCVRSIADYSSAIVGDDGIKKDSGRIGHISDAIDYLIFIFMKRSNRPFLLK